MAQRRRRIALTSIVLLALALSRACPALAGTETGHYRAKAGDQPLRVGLVRHFKGVKQITVLASSDYAVTRTGSTDKLASCTNLEPITIEAGTSQISLKPVSASSVNAGVSVTITSNDPSGMISVDSPGRPSKQYRGTIEVTLKSGCLNVVNVVGMEDYLPGVLTGEMPSSYPDEALKAQAVAARSFTLCALRRHASLGYDLCDDSHCQVYDGALREKPSCTRAVLATKGQVLAYKGRVASIMYCADCGGVTECYAEAHSDVVPYLPSVVEPAGINHRAWEKSYALAELSAKLLAGGVKEAEGLTKVSVTKTSTSGRALAIEIDGSKGSTTVSGLKLRSILGRSGIRSTLFTVDATVDGTVTFKGKGFGHGIGLCQVGAGALAAPPYSYTCEQILAHYYPGTTLSGSLEAKQTEAKGAPHPRPLLRGEGEGPIQSTAPVDVRVEEPAL